MSDRKSNTWDDDDFSSVLANFEDLDAQAEKIMAAARGEVSGIRAKQKALKKEAADDLGIPRKVLNATIKTRRLERELEKIAKGVDEEFAELFEDAMGQFSFLKPTEKEQGKSGAQIAAARAAKAAKENEEAEQAEGEQVLDELTKGQTVN